VIKDTNLVNVSGKIFWSKLDERESYSTLRLGIDIGEGSYNRIFATISNPHEKAHQFVKTDNQVLLIGAWLDTWEKNDGSKDLQIKAYDFNSQFFLAEAKIPHVNEVTIYGSVYNYSDGIVTVDCIGGKNPKTGEYTHRKMEVTIGEDLGDVTNKKIYIKGTIGSEEIAESKSVMKVFANYDNINILG